MTFLAALLVAAYLGSAFHSGAWWDIPAGDLLAQGASFAPAVAGGESWRLVSALFLHGGLLHLVFNTLALLQIGHLLTPAIGLGRTLSIFVLAGAWGFFASLVWQPEVISVGASGGIFGLLGTWAALALHDRQADRAAAPRRRRRLGVLLVLLLALGFGFLVPNVDHAAHLGGLACGLLLGAIARPAKWRWPVFFAGAVLLAGGLGLATRQLPAAWRIEYDEAHRYAARYQQFALEDRAISQALQDIGAASRRNELSDAEGLTRLDRDLLPRLARLAERWRDGPWQSPRLAREAVRWAAYSQFRLDAVTALRNAIAAETSAAAALELDRFEKLMTAAAQLAYEGAVETPPAGEGGSRPPPAKTPPEAAAR